MKIRCSKAKAAFSSIIMAFVLALFICQTSARAELRVSNLFGEHMVIQSGQPIHVFGRAKPGDTVGAKIGESKGVAQVQPNGDWHITMPALPPGGPYELIVRGEQEIRVKDVLIGEVFLCSGQSNMVINLEHSKLPTNITGDPEIRFFTPKERVNREPAKNVIGSWRTLNPGWSKECPALPYYFAMEMKEKLKRPIGIVETAATGSPIQSWMSLEKLYLMKQGEGLLTDLDEQFKQYAKRLETGSQSQQIASSEYAIPEKRQKASGLTLNFPATSLYNCMIAPIAPFGVKGILWYQGEANIYEAQNYHRYFTNLIQDWRKAWNRHDLPFYYVQLPPVGEKSIIPSMDSLLAELREAQSRTNLVPYTYMTCALDSVINSAEPDWHSSDKRLLGRRMARVVLATQYEMPFPIKGPTLDSVTLEGDKLRIKFRNANKGLALRGATDTGFAIAGDDKKYLWASVKVENDCLLVWNDAIKQPRYVTYGWANNPNACLFSGDNLPAGPFRSKVATRVANK